MSERPERPVRSRSQPAARSSEEPTGTRRRELETGLPTPPLKPGGGEGVGRRDMYSDNDTYRYKPLPVPKKQPRGGSSTAVLPMARDRPPAFGHFQRKRTCPSAQYLWPLVVAARSGHRCG
jgi:hypothetical protein